MKEKEEARLLLLKEQEKELREKGFNIREDILTIEEAKEEILKAVKGGKQC